MVAVIGLGAAITLTRSMRRMRRLNAGPPRVLELRFGTPGSQQPDTHYALRFPVAFGAEAAAQGLIDHYNRRHDHIYRAR